MKWSVYNSLNISIKISSYWRILLPNNKNFNCAGSLFWDAGDLVTLLRVLQHLNKLERAYIKWASYALKILSKLKASAQSKNNSSILKNYSNSSIFCFLLIEFFGCVASLKKCEGDCTIWTKTKSEVALS